MSEEEQEGIAEEAEESSEESSTEKKKGDKGMGELFSMFGVAVALMVATPALVMFTVSRLVPPAGKVEVAKDPAKQGKLEVRLPPVEMNVSDTLGTRYAQIDIVLTVTEEDMLKLFKEYTESNPSGKLHQIMSLVNEIMSDKPIETLLAREGKETLAKEIRIVVNNVIAKDTEGMVSDVYFTRFLVQ